MSKICSYCGTIVEDTAKKCSFCGNEIEHDLVRESKKGLPERNKMQINKKIIVWSIVILAITVRVSAVIIRFKAEFPRPERVPLDISSYSVRQGPTLKGETEEETYHKYHEYIEEIPVKESFANQFLQSEGAKKFVEEVFNKSADTITREDINKIKYMNISNKKIEYSFSKKVMGDKIPGVKTVTLADGIYFDEDEDIYSFTGIIKLELDDDLTNQDKISQLTALKSLSVSASDSSERQIWEDLIHLEELKITGSSLKDLSSLKSFTSLKKLSLNRTSIDDIPKLIHLKELVIEDEKITDIYFLKNLENLTTLSIIDTNVKNIEVIKNLKQLKSLTLFENNLLRDGTPVSMCTNLEYLNLDSQDMDEKPNLSQCVKLERLRLTGSDSLIDLKSLKNLKELHIQGGKAAADLSPLSSLNNLEILDLKGDEYLNSMNMTSLAPLVGLSNLKDLDLSYCSLYFDAKHLYQIKSLEKLNITSAVLGGDIGLLSNLTNLKELRMDEVAAVTNVQVYTDGFYTSISYDDLILEDKIKSLSKLKKLKTLSLAENELKNIDFVSDLKELTYLDISENYITDVSWVKELKKLKYLNIYSNPIEDSTVLDHIKNLQIENKEEKETGF